MVIVGAGLMGCGTAADLLAHGRPAVLLVRDEARIDAARQQTLALVATLGAGSAAPLSVQAPSAFTGWGDAALVVESVP